MNEKITSEYFENLYSKKDDEKVIKLDDAPGITIIKPYPKEYADREEYRMFIRFYLLEDGFVHGGINMIEEKTWYVREDEGQFDKSFTNFSLEISDKIIYDFNSQRFIIKRWWINHKYTVDKFIDLFIKNHLRKKPLLPKIREKIKIYFLKIIFWLIDDKYDWWNYYVYMRDKKQETSSISKWIVRQIEKPKDPFFKYFYIYKHLLSVSICIVFFFILWGYIFFSNCNEHNNALWTLFKSEYFGVDNPIYFFWFFVVLFFLEILSSYFESDFNNHKWFIYKIHNSVFYGSFNLRIF